jgi:hypothetical protein
MAHRTDTTTAPPAQSDTPSPAPSHEQSRPPSTAGRRLGWAAVVASLVAAAALAVVVLAGTDNASETDPVPGVHSGLIEHGSIRSIEGSVEDASALAGPDGSSDHGSIRSIEGTVETTAPARGLVPTRPVP